VCSQVRAGNAELAQYATWVLSEWVRRTSRERPRPAEALGMVRTALETGVFDARLGVRAGAARGLAALLAACPEEPDNLTMAVLREDKRVAIRRALQGIG
jgi:hypothetical protein